MNFKSLKNQILIIFLLLIFLSITSTIITAIYFGKKEELNNLSKKVLEVEILLFKSYTEQENFINFENTNEQFYESGSSVYIENFINYQNQFNNKLLELDSCSNTINSSTVLLNQIKNDNVQYLNLFLKLKRAITKRGFKNSGVVGQMRKQAHIIEDSTNIDLEKTLMLRRHEKDYIIRQDNRYLEKHDQLIKDLVSSSSNQKEINLLNIYSKHFNTLALYERFIGLKGNEGLKKQLINCSQNLQKGLNELNKNIETSKTNLLEKINIYIIVFWLLFLILISFLAINLSNRLSYRITFLSREINGLVKSGFKNKVLKPVHLHNDEVGLLWSNFLLMEKEIKAYLNNFAEKVEEKTLELSNKNRLIEKQKSEIEIQRNTSEAQNKDLLDGIRYAWRIQQALIPSTDNFKKNIKNGFVFFSPKDIVSGDIYWARNFKNDSGDDTFFSVIDCTGHGVPGAFMSILALNAINDSMFRLQNYSPKTIIQGANDYIFSAMKYYVDQLKSNATKDGMDLAFCKLNRKSLKLSYLGACRPLYILRKKITEQEFQLDLANTHYRVFENEDTILFEVFPLKKSIGTLNKEDSTKLKERTIGVQKNDFIYLFSDGYPDQFGGPKNKKFMIKKFRELLMKIYFLKPEVQNEIIKNTIIEWQGQVEQIDDICIMGVKV